MLNTKAKLALTAILIGVAQPSVSVADFTAPSKVTRIAPDKIQIEWFNKNPISIYQSDTAKIEPKNSKLISNSLKSGAIEINIDPKVRPYFLLVDNKDKKSQSSAERALSLDAGSNFRDIGGYKVANGKSVKWGLIFRSGAMANLTENDLAQINGLKLNEIIDLRSGDERQIAPTKVQGVNYHAFNYDFGSMMPKSKEIAQTDMLDLYRNFPHFFVPQLKILFKELLAFDGPVLYNCSAGQDRTGFTTAMILSALGVPKATIIEDYHLSTIYRKPANEFPKIDLTLFKDNAAAQMFAHYQTNPKYQNPTVLKTENGTAYLEGAFLEINEKWGSVDNYLRKEIGLSKTDIAKLRLLYLE